MYVTITASLHQSTQMFVETQVGSSMLIFILSTLPIITPTTRGAHPC